MGGASFFLLFLSLGSSLEYPPFYAQCMSWRTGMVGCLLDAFSIMVDTLCALSIIEVMGLNLKLGIQVAVSIYYLDTTISEHLNMRTIEINQHDCG